MSTAIEFNNISKQYRLGLVSTRTLGADLNRWWAMNVRHKEDPYLKIGSVNDRASAADSEFVWALRDIDFKVKQGDVVGIIGRNGSGKSTLLKLLSRVTAPTTGTICAKGRIGSLLEVGTGFHPEMTGRENIFLNGAILGMTKNDISRKLDEIVDFSGCERYLDTPTKRYSSGMTVRLGFAVAAFLDPEILVVDEVLAVGDAEFQKKAIGKMQDVSTGEGRTVLFVSHNMRSVRALCNKGVVLNNGMIHYNGTVDDAIDEYMLLGMENHLGASLSDYPRVTGCSGKVVFDGVEFFDPNDNVCSPRCGQFVRVRMRLNVKVREARDFHISFDISDMYGSKLITFPSAALMDGFNLHAGEQIVTCDIPKFPLTVGNYRLTLWCSVGKETSDYIDSLIKMEVDGDDYFGIGRKTSQNLLGKVVLCDYSWKKQD